MIPRVQVEVRVPRAVYDALQDAQGMQAFLREVGVLSPQAQEIRWRMDVVTTSGYVLTYSVPLTRSTPGRIQHG
jgi:hypothetical protein